MLHNEEGCQDMRWEVGSWRQDISYEKETNVRKCRGLLLLLWLDKLKCIAPVSAMINTTRPGQNPALKLQMPPTISSLFLGLK